MFWEGLGEFFGNYMLISAILSWFVAQIIKIFTGLYQNGKMSLAKIIFSTGGMPSSHSATIVALATAAGMEHGLGSPLFAIATILATIVMIDATGVRYETGKQGKFLNEIAAEIFSGNPEKADAGFKELVGHTPLQVIMGALLGFGVAFGLSFLMLV